MSPVEQYLFVIYHILKLQHHAVTLTTLAQRNNCIAHLLQERWRCFARQRSPAASRG
ncbi:hypothetical protein [Nostoc sp. ATCC 53789]|uniref:hypothetical protein n=1 Tax=Nostoc sp. ATCC 53789 TaxID=76335 RepID=UPI00132ED643|nr:hypothetical protein [Nostoc sp. ATCC 53789]QHG20219.1 hypothetical protein GJB62_30160 [Nostoc sp. ATCC 53789]